MASIDLVSGGKGKERRPNREVIIAAFLGKDWGRYGVNLVFLDGMMRTRSHHLWQQA
jgi:hypothetical protein